MMHTDTPMVSERQTPLQAQLCQKSSAHQILESSVSWQMSLLLTTPPSTHDSSQLVLETKQNDGLLLNGRIVSVHICQVQYYNLTYADSAQ